MTVTLTEFFRNLPERLWRRVTPAGAAFAIFVVMFILAAIANGYIRWQP